MSRKLLPLILAGLCVAPAFGQQCRMSRAFSQPDTNSLSGTRQTAVWADPSASSLFFVESLEVNTDGTRRSYSVDDFWGQRVAINNLCNAMGDACDGLNNTQLRARRIVTQRALAAGWPHDLLAQTRISESIIPFKGGKPCPLLDGFLVSATALHKRVVADPCDITNYVDALEVPALVLPRNPKNGRSGFDIRHADVGDLVVVMLPGGTSPVLAVVGDKGPPNKLGEGSVALNGKLLGRTGQPQNYDEVRGRPPFRGRGWGVPRALVLVFPATRDEREPYMTATRIEEAARRRFDEWGGVARLNACAREYPVR